MWPVVLLYANNVKVQHFKANNSETKQYMWFLRKDITVNNMEKTG